jgi:hypothetical protein
VAVVAVVGVEVGELHLLDRLEHRPDQVLPGHPVAKRRGHQKRLLTTTFDEVGGHAGIVLAAPDATAFPDSHDDERARRSAVLLFDVAVGKTPGDLLRALLDPR